MMGLILGFASLVIQKIWRDFAALGLDQCERYGFTWEWFGHGTWAGRETLELGSTVWVWDLASQKRCHISDAKKLYEKL